MQHVCSSQKFIEKKILIIKDSTAFSSQLRQILHSCDNVDILLASDVEGSEELVRSGDYDLILIDYTFPVKKGEFDLWAFCKTLCPKVPAIFMSGSSMCDFVQTINSANDVPNSFSPMELVEIILSSLNDR